MNPSLKRQLFKTFAKMISDLNNQAEAEEFLNGFFNTGELEKYVKRISIVYWLKKGRDLDNIKRNLLATDSEIDSVRELINKKGVKLAVKKIEAEEWANLWAERIQKISGIR